MRLAILCLLLPALLGAATAGAQALPATLSLWKDGAPGALGNGANDIPTLTVYLPAEGQASGAAIVICPGGGYAALADHEGQDYARFLNEHGIAGFVLKYRLGRFGYRHPRMLEDAARAVRTVRARAAEWKVDPERIGIMGSSAGGHLASTLMTHFDAGDPSAADPIDRVSSRPDLGILCYPVITMRPPHAHMGSRRQLLGDNPSGDMVQLLSNELQVTAQTPPAFVWHTWEDKGVSVENSLEFAAALRRAGVPFDLHVYERGRHGIGLGDNRGKTTVHPWTRDLVFWLKERGFINK